MSSQNGSSLSVFDVRMDSLMSVFSGLKNPYTGMGDPYVDPNQHTYIQPGLSRLSRVEQSALVRQSGLLKKLVTNLPKAATWRWGRTTLANGNAKQLQAIADALNDIRVETPLQRIGKTRKGYQMAGEVALQTGNAGFVLDIDDGRQFNEPLDRKNIKRIRKMALLSRHALRPDLTNLREGPPEYYVVLNAYNLKDFSSGQKIHRSRVHWFRGVPILDDYDLIANQGCDDSILELVRDAYYLYDPAVRAAGRMLTSFDVKVRKVKDLAQNIADRGDEYVAELSQRIRVDEMTASEYRTQVIDMDMEGLDNWTRQVGGMSDLLDRVKDNLKSSIDVPPAVAFGEFASGLDSSGKSTTEKELWNESSQQFQIDKYDDNLQDLQTLVCLCKDGPTNGEVPEGLGWEWLVPYPPSPGEQADLELKRAQLIQDLNGVDPRFGKVAIAATYGQKEYQSAITLPKAYADALQRDIKEEAKPKPTEPDTSALEGEPPSADAPQNENQPPEDDQAQQDQSIVDDILNDRTLLDSADSPIDVAYAKYHSAVNMSASELLAWSKTRWSKMAGVDLSPIQRNLRLLQKPKDQWTAADATQALRTVSFIARMRGTGKGEPVSADAPAWMTKRLISLRNWGADIRKAARRDSSDVHLDATRQELLAKAKAKNEGMAKGKKFNTFGKSNAAIAEFVGEGIAQPATTKATAKAKGGTKGGKYQTAKTSSAIATAIAKKTGAEPEAIEKDLRGKIQKAIDKTRREAKKAGKEPTDKELRAAARAVVKVEATSAIAAARGEGKPAAETVKTATIKPKSQAKATKVKEKATEKQNAGTAKGSTGTAREKEKPETDKGGAVRGTTAGRETVRQTNPKLGSHDVVDPNLPISEKIKQVATLTGESDAKAKEMVNGINQFTSGNLADIRKVDAGLSVSSFVDRNEIQKTADAINLYVQKMPKFEGAIHRGLAFDSEEDRNNFLATTTNGFEIKALSSFSSSQSIAKEYADSGFDSKAVIINVKNNHSGASIKSLATSEDDEEVLVPKGAKYKLVKQYTKNGDVHLDVEEDHDDAPAKAEPVPAKKGKATGEKKAKTVKAEKATVSEVEAKPEKKARSAKPKASEVAAEKPVAEPKAEKPIAAAKTKKVKPKKIANPVFEPRNEQTETGSIQTDKSGLDEFFKVGDNDVHAKLRTLSLAPLKPGSNKKYVNIDFQVNEGFDVGSVSGKDALKVALSARSTLLGHISKLKDGVVVSNSPYSKDGHGEQRAKLYQKSGFGETDKDGTQWAMVQGGKLVPLTKNEMLAMA